MAKKKTASARKKKSASKKVTSRKTSSKSKKKTKAKTNKRATKKSAKRSQKKATKKSKARRKGRSGATADRKRRAESILEGLHRLYGDADCALHHTNAFELLIATILSAQSTDNNVNKVTPHLFERFPTPSDLAEGSLEEVESIVHSTGFYRQKAKNIIGAAQRLRDDFGGEVPQSIEELTSLPGVARKTANVVLGTWFGLNHGVVVDTHVGRLSERMGLTWSARDSKDALRIEQDLMQVVPQAEWTFLSHALIWHGRETCSARSPLCDECELEEYCQKNL